MNFQDYAVGYIPFTSFTYSTNEFLHKQYNNISPLLFYSIIGIKQENGSTRMIQSISSKADLVVALASSKSSLGTCKTTMKKIIHLCVKNTKNIKSRLQK